MGAVKWIGGVIGWATGGFLGSIIGYAIGSAVDNAISGQQANGGWQEAQQGRTRGSRPVTQEGDFGVSLLVLSASVMKSDNRVVKAELDFVKAFFVKNFGVVKAGEYILLLRDLLAKEYDMRAACQQIKLFMDHASRVQLLHYLFGLSMADGEAHPKEIETIRAMASWLGISTADHDSIKAMFIKDKESPYKILELTPEASNEDIKKAYKKMAVKYHPDKVSHLGEDVQKAANEKFKEVNQAYETLKKARGMN